MGCFASTCPVSNLAIEAGDPVRFAFLQKNDNIPPLHVTESYKFWTPLFKGQYNHYGTVEWDNVQDLEQLQYLLDLLRPSLRNLKEYSKNLDIDNLDYQTLFNSIAYRDLVYDPSRELKESKEDLDLRLRLRIRKEENFYLFMMHEWAFDFLAQKRNEEEFYEDYLPELAKQLDSFVMTEKEQYAIYESSKDDCPEAANRLYYTLFIAKHKTERLDGISSDAPFTKDFRELYYETPVLQYKESLRKKIEDTKILTEMLFNIRTPLMPLHTVGSSQAERNRTIKPWLDLLKAKAADQYKQFEEDEI